MAWSGALGQARQQVIAQLVEVAGASVGIGEPGDGVAGFRETHEQAQEALDTALRTDVRLARYGEVALMSGLAAHPGRSRRTMRWYLGALDADTPAMARLRETLRVLLDASLNQREAARRMGVHAHTVGYRLQQIEKLLGCSLAERSVELRTALIIRDAQLKP